MGTFDRVLSISPGSKLIGNYHGGMNIFQRGERTYVVKVICKIDLYVRSYEPLYFTLVSRSEEEQITESYGFQTRNSVTSAIFLDSVVICKNRNESSIETRINSFPITFFFFSFFDY